MQDVFTQFVSRLGVMKPAAIDEKNERHQARIEEILLSSDYVAEEKIDGCHYLIVGSRFLVQME